MLLKAEFESNMGFLDPTIEAMLAAGEGTYAYVKSGMAAKDNYTRRFRITLRQKKWNYYQLAASS